MNALHTCWNCAIECECGWLSIYQWTHKSTNQWTNGKKFYWIFVANFINKYAENICPCFNARIYTNFNAIIGFSMKCSIRLCNMCTAQWNTWNSIELKLNYRCSTKKCHKPKQMTSELISFDILSHNRPRGSLLIWSIFQTFVGTKWVSSSN